jgi:RHS repeat-associated protein
MTMKSLKLGKLAAAGLMAAVLSLIHGAVLAQTLHFVHPDHLNTPRVITNQASQVVWRWDQTEPFGADPANENPTGLGAFVYNLRLPGQHFDKETNLHYNYFRDYDSAIGRYIQSDPVGLRGGINTYAYSYDNPLTYTDPRGLDVTINQFPGGVGHIGIGINTTNTVGLYPVQKFAPGNFTCGTVPGFIGTDIVFQDPRSIRRSRSITFRTEPWQDKLMQDRINLLQANSPTYNICVDQCTAFVTDVLRAGGVFIYPSNEITPSGLFDVLQGIYGR